MKRLRSIVTVVFFVAAFIFLQICSREISHQENMILKNTRAADLIVDIDESLADLVENYRISIDQTQLVHDFTDKKVGSKYSLRLELKSQEDKLSQEKLKNISNRIAYSLNSKDSPASKLSNININWNEDVDQGFSYRFGSFSPELVK